MSDFTHPQNGGSLASGPMLSSPGDSKRESVEGHLVGALDSQGSAIEALHDVIAKLTGRMSPLLAPEQDGNGGILASGHQVTLVSHVLAHTDRIGEAANALHSILDRLAL